MDGLLATTIGNPFAAIAGAAAMLCLAAWPLFRTRSTMLMTYLGNNLGFVAHYALLGQWTASAMNGLMGVQTLVALWLIKWPPSMGVLRTAAAVGRRQRRHLARPSVVPGGSGGDAVDDRPHARQRDVPAGLDTGVDAVLVRP
jgi:hypothetical protein